MSRHASWLAGPLPPSLPEDARPSWMVPSSAQLPLMPPRPQSGPSSCPPVEFKTVIRESVLPGAVLQQRSSAPPPSSSLREPSLRVVMPPPELVALQEENEYLRVELAKLATRFGQFREDVLRATEPEVVRLACDIAERLIGEELKSRPEIVATWVHAAIDSLPNKENVVVAIAPDIAVALAGREPDWGGRLEIDPNLSRGSCEVRSQPTTVDVGPEAQVQAVRQHLGLQDE